MTAKNMSITQYLQDVNVRTSVEQVMGDRRNQFVASVASLVTSSPALAECDKKTILSACLTAASLNLPINQNLGFAYIIPYNKNVKIDPTPENGNKIVVWEKKKEAQFQMGWKGFVQLAIRTKEYKFINTTDVREGEIGKKNRLTGEIKFKWIDDEKERDSKDVIGYIAYFKLKSGFSKELYMSIEELKGHGVKYSKSYDTKESKWKTDFDAMSRKTVIKLLISKFGPMSTELEKAIEADQGVIDGEKITYPDNTPISKEEQANEKERMRAMKHIEEADTLEKLKVWEPSVDGDEELQALYRDKADLLKIPETK